MNDTYNIDQVRVNYLSGEGCAAYYDKMRDLEVKFGMRETKPQSAEELVKRIKADQFSLRDEVNYGYGGLLGHFRWNLNVKDKEGFEKADKALSEAKKVLDDAIMLKSTDEAYKALETFRKWEYSA